MKQKNTPTKADAAMYAASILRWQNKLGLIDWRVEPGERAAKGAMATVEFNPAARLAIWRLGDFGAEVITPESLSLVALHECLHILLFDLVNVASARSTDEELESSEHRVINVLEKLLKDLA